MLRSLSSVTPPVKLPLVNVGMFRLAPLALMVPPAMVPPLKLSEPVVVFKVSGVTLLSRMPVRKVVPPVLTRDPRLAVEKVPPRLTLPAATAMVPVFDQLPAVVRLALADVAVSVPALVQAVPVTVRVPAPSALMLPRLVRPRPDAPMVPALPCTSMPAPRVRVPEVVGCSVLLATLEKNTPPVVIADPAWARMPPLMKFTVAPLPAESRLRRVLSCRVRPPVTFRVEPLAMLRSLSSVTPPVKLPDVNVGMFRLAPLALMVAFASVPPLRVMDAPVKLMLPPLLSMVPLMVLVPTALRVTLSRLPLLPEMLAPEEMMMLPSALSVSVRAPPLLLRIATPALTVMLPAPPVPAPVWMVTLVLPLSAALICVSPIDDEVSGSNRPATRVPTEPLTTVTLLGSSSQSPSRPPGPAAVLMRNPSTTRLALPEVSIRPPSPPRAPPATLMLPCTRVASFDQMITRPPLPRSSASASSTASAVTVVRSALWMSWFLP